jgi:hypothetical protein
MRFDSSHGRSVIRIASAFLLLGFSSGSMLAQTPDRQAAVDLATLSGEWRGDVVVTKGADCSPNDNGRGHAFVESPRVRLILMVSADGDVAAGESSGAKDATPEMRWRGRIDSDMRVTLEAPGEMLCGNDRHPARELGPPEERSSAAIRPYVIRYAGTITRRGNGWQLDVRGDDQPCGRTHQCGLVRALRLRKR